jgi:tRNA G18 (ribose-2'-O)-methylase SpoU
MFASYCSICRSNSVSIWRCVFRFLAIAAAPIAPHRAQEKLARAKTDRDQRHSRCPIDVYRDIRERDLVGRAGLFVAEGKVVVEKLADSALHQPISLLIASKRVDTLERILSRLSDEVPVYVAAQGVIDEIAGFPLHRGILAIGRRTGNPTADDLLAAVGESATILMLSGIANHDNRGGIFRNAAAFGVNAILLDADCCDPLYRKAIRASVGATLLVPFTQLARQDDPVELLERHAFVPVALSPAGECLLAQWRPGPRTAVILGAEGRGLSADLLPRVWTGVQKGL